jgi:hypothetical protein
MGRAWKKMRAWFRRNRADRPRFGGTQGRWFQKPAVRICSDNQEHRTAVYWAAEWWALQMQREVFDVSTVRMGDSNETGMACLGFPVRGVVSVVTEPTYRTDVRASTELFWEDVHKRHLNGAHIAIRPDLTGDALRRAVAHELGHVMGLKHTRGSADQYLMDVDGTGKCLLPQELAHVRAQVASYHSP